jgi:hypothetical protein
MEVKLFLREPLANVGASHNKSGETGKSADRHNNQQKSTKLKSPISADS